jgi:hypothetical protein
MKEFIDASVFMGLHSRDEQIRIVCKNFFIERMNKKLFMSFEHVGKCDDMVWQFDRRTQDAYYPFMDRLHTVMDIQRMPYDMEDINMYCNDFATSTLSTLQKLTCSMVLAKKGVLYTLDKELLDLKHDSFQELESVTKEAIFPGDLEEWYQKSLVLQT